jgi:hypothetical protein
MEWIDWVDQQWFFSDCNAPWGHRRAVPACRKASRETRQRCDQALADFMAGRPVLGAQASWKELDDQLWKEICYWRIQHDEW